jgi:undecaprenyl-diphosphatase
MPLILRQSYSLILLRIILPLFCFFGIAIAVFSNDFSLVWDVTILEKIYAIASPDLDAIAFALTQLGRGKGIAAIALFVSLFLGSRKQWRSLRYLLITIIGSGLLNLSVKFLFHRHRPTLWDSLSPELDFSFPSGHAMLSLTLSIAIAVLVPQRHWRSLFLFCGVMLAIAIGWSRLYLGVHYPSDILSGWALAIAWVTGISWLSKVNVKL